MTQTKQQNISIEQLILRLILQQQIHLPIEEASYSLNLPWLTRKNQMAIQIPNKPTPHLMNYRNLHLRYLVDI